MNQRTLERLASGPPPVPRLAALLHFSKYSGLFVLPYAIKWRSGRRTD